MKREEHENIVRSKILSASRQLFLEQGYNETKIRQIKEVAEVKIGTIYHFYKNKEDIFSTIVEESFIRVRERTKELAGEDKVLHLATELAWHTCTMAFHPPSAELYLIAYNSTSIAKEMIASLVARSQEVFGEDLDHELFVMTIKGLMQSVSIKAVRKELTDSAKMSEGVTRTLCLCAGLEEHKADSLVAKIKAFNLGELVVETLKAMEKERQG